MQYATHRAGKEHFYAYIRKPPPSFPTYDFDDGTIVPYGWCENTVEVGPTNSLYMHVDVNDSGEPIGVEVLDADEKFTPGWREYVHVDQDRQGVTLGDAARVVMDITATYGTIRAQLAYDRDKKLVRMGFREISQADPIYDPDRFEDPAFEAFLGLPLLNHAGGKE